MQCSVNREKNNPSYRIKKHALLAAVLVVLLLLPANAFAVGATGKTATVTTQEQLLEALNPEASAASIKLAEDISTTQSITIPEGTVIDLEEFNWTVDGGTVAVLPGSVVGTGKFTAGKNGTIRMLTAVALESAMVGEVVKSVTYTDGEVDDSDNYIKGYAVAADSTVQMYLKNNKLVKRVTTAQASYRLGTANMERLSLVYGITYNLDGGKIENGANPTEYTASDTAITLINPTREGYTFLGWTGTGLTEPTETVTIPMQSTGSRSYTALWEESEEMDSPTQGGSGGMGSRPSGGGSGSGSGGGFSGLSGSLSFDISTEDEEETEEIAEEVPDTAAQSQSGMQQQNSRRISTASSSVEVAFSGAKPVVDTVTVGNGNPRIDLPKLFAGAGLLLVAVAGAVLLIKKKD